jgi:hypothetical protein
VGDRLVDLLRVGDVETGRRRAVAEALAQIGDRRGVARRQHHAVAAPERRERDVAAHAGRAARDEPDLVARVRHHAFSSSRHA